MADYGTAISLSRELSHTSDDSSSDQSPRSVPPSSSSKHNKVAISSPDSYHHHHQFHHHSAVEIQRKPRGRPPGSKNKPKPPIIITKDSDSTMKPTILEISAGSDIIESVINFARRNHSGITVISATGSVSNVTLRHPVSHAPSLSLHGPFNLLSLTGSYFGSFAPKQSSSSSSSSPGTSPASCCFGISLSGTQGQVFGGIVAGKVLAASQVVVVAATFLSPIFHRLPIDHNDDECEETKPSLGGPASVTSAAANESCVSTGMSMSVYGVANPAPINCQMSPPDIMHWPGPPSRPHY